MKIVSEGFTGVKESFGADDWDAVYDALRAGEVLQKKVQGVAGDKEKPHLLVFLGSIKGVVLFEETGESDPRRLKDLVDTVIYLKVKVCDRANGVVYLSRKAALDEIRPLTVEKLERLGRALREVQERIVEVASRDRGLREAGRPAGDAEVSAEQAVEDGTSEIAVEDSGPDGAGGDAALARPVAGVEAAVPGAPGLRISDVRLGDLSPEARAEVRRLRDKAREVGPVVTATVREVYRTGANVDIGGVKAFLPAEEMSWGRVEDARQCTWVQPGVSFDVRVTQVDFDRLCGQEDDRAPVRVSLKALLPDPWERAGEKYERRGVYAGIVRRVTRRGDIAVELEPGVEAVCGRLPLQRLAPGTPVKVFLKKVDPKEKYISGVIRSVSRWAG